jgi:hypothetical protein
VTIVNHRIGDAPPPYGTTRVHAPAGMRWLQVEAGFWVANVDGNFGGTVERVGERFHARDAMSVELGVFADAESAKSAVEAGR